MRRLIGLIAASVGIVALVAVLLHGGQQAGPVPTSSSAMSQQLGVRGDGVDAARRPVTDDAGQPVLSLARIEEVSAGESTGDAGRAAPEPPPVAPVPPSAADIAHSEAVLAARPQVRAAVDAALEDGRVAIRRRCWTGDVPDSASFPLEATYSAGGQLLAFSMHDDPAAPGVGECVRNEPIPVPGTIEPPGVSVNVQTAFTLP